MTRFLAYAGSRTFKLCESLREAEQWMDAIGGGRLYELHDESEIESRNAAMQKLLDKSAEYQQVAALVCEDIELLLDLATQAAANPERTKEDMRWCINDLKKKKDLLISNKDYREERFALACTLLSIGK